MFEDADQDDKISRLIPAALLLLTFLSPATPALQAGGSINGAWAGSVIVKHDGQTHEEQIHTVLKEAEGVVTGTAGPDADNQYRILKGKVTSSGATTAVTFEVIVNGALMSFTLKLADGRLKGDVKIEGEDGRPQIATVDLKRLRESFLNRALR